MNSSSCFAKGMSFSNSFSKDLTRGMRSMEQLILRIRIRINTKNKPITTYAHI